MNNPHGVRLELYYGDAEPGRANTVLALVYSPKVSICSQYADLRDENGKLVATITWTSPVVASRLDT